MGDVQGGVAGIICGAVLESEDISIRYSRKRISGLGGLKASSSSQDMGAWHLLMIYLERGLNRRFGSREESVYSGTLAQNPYWRDEGNFVFLVLIRTDNR